MKYKSAHFLPTGPVPRSHLPAGNEVFAIPSCSLLFPPVSPVICRHSCADLRGRVYICPKLKTVRGTQQSAVTLRPHRTLTLPRATHRSLAHTSFLDLRLLSYITWFTSFKRIERFYNGGVTFYDFYYDFSRVFTNDYTIGGNLTSSLYSL